MGIIPLGHPMLHIANRWLRWLLIALLFALLLDNQEWTVEKRSLLPLFLIAFLAWFLLETMINWAKISTFSRSDYPLFPRYLINHNGDEWPVEQKAIEIKEWLSKNGFKKVQSLKFGNESSLVLRTTFYEDKTSTYRIQIHFLPPNQTGRTMFFVVTTLAEDDTRFTTDNISMPFAIYVPENWDLYRKPLVISLPKLLSIHKERVKGKGKTLIPWGIEPQDDLDRQRRHLEQVNIDHGFLYPSNYHDEYGRLTPEGRYRMWKEMWLLSYLGCPLSQRPNKT
jgi:hypothetical protein